MILHICDKGNYQCDKAIERTEKQEWLLVYGHVKCKFKYFLTSKSGPSYINLSILYRSILYSSHGAEIRLCGSIQLQTAIN